MWTHYNPNPAGRNVGDCTVRALSKALDQDWYTTYLGLCVEGGLMGDMPSANATWGAYLRRQANRLSPLTFWRYLYVLQTCLPPV